MKIELTLENLHKEPVLEHYTYKDKQGVRWRLDGSRPISEIADQVMEEIKKEHDGSDKDKH